LFSSSITTRLSSARMCFRPVTHEQRGVERWASVDRFRIGVAPARALDQRERLFASLEQVFPVIFEGRDAGELDHLDGLLILDGIDRDGLAPGVPVLLTPSPAYAVTGESIQFSNDESVARALRGRALGEEEARGGLVPACGERDGALATVRGRPVWWRRASAGVAVSAFSIEELAGDEALRERLRPGRFAGLVALLHFLRELCEGAGWSERPLRASFVIDDPNLHWPSYGFLDFAELIRAASAHRYHAGLAMVPLDGWLVSRRAAELVRENGDAVSLLVHGNDHVARELGRLAGDSEAEPLIAQALRRVARFERRSGVYVRRVMAPPHGACSEPAMRAMFRLGFDAACISRPYPWRGREPAPSAIAGWHPAELVAGGLPVLPRHHLDGPREELIFRALLGQPLILYGHHGDFAEGLDVLAHAAEDIDRLGDVRWGPLDEIAAASYRTRRHGELLVLELHSRRVRVEVPEGVTAISVRASDVHCERLWGGISCDTGRSVEPAIMRKVAGGWASDPLEVRPPAQIELSLSPDRPLRENALPGPAVRPWPITRRILVESRDRVRPLLGARATS
jgi:hypothetical protein